MNTKRSLQSIFGLSLITLGAAFISTPAAAKEPTEAVAVQVGTHAVANTQFAVAELQKKLAAIKSFSAHFTQTTQDSLGNTLQTVKGFMQVAKPGKLRWKTEGIYEQLVVSDGKSLWIYDADLEQVSIKNLDNRLAETPALLLGGDISAIDDDFIISKAPSDNQLLYILQPKDTGQLFDSLELSFNNLAKDKPLSEMIIRDASGQITRITFTGVETNPKFNEEIFRFTPPKGIDVIDGRQ